MKNADIADPLFLEAVEAIDRGDIVLLDELLTKNKHLVYEKLDYPEPGYFQNPYLLWFVADNPIRIEKLAANIVDITKLLILFVKNEAADSMQHQLDYALGLVATGRIPKACGVQIAMMDALIDAGATAGSGLSALAQGNFEAAAHLVARGGKLTLATAVGLNRMDDVKQMTATAGKDELLVALTTAAFYGQPDVIAYLLSVGAPVNGYPENDHGFHSHGTPLHQAIQSGSLQSVKLLVEAGASLQAPDKIYEGTPLGWAMHMENDAGADEEAKQKFRTIVAYLRGR